MLDGVLERARAVGDLADRGEQRETLPVSVHPRPPARDDEREHAHGADDADALDVRGDVALAPQPARDGERHRERPDDDDVARPAEDRREQRRHHDDPDHGVRRRRPGVDDGKRRHDRQPRSEGEHATAIRRQPAVVRRRRRHAADDTSPVPPRPHQTHVSELLLRGSEAADVPRLWSRAIADHISCPYDGCCTTPRNASTARGVPAIAGSSRRYESVVDLGHRTRPRQPDDRRAATRRAVPWRGSRAVDAAAGRPRRSRPGCARPRSRAVDGRALRRRSVVVGARQRDAT